MHDFYRQALLRLIALLVASGLATFCCIERSHMAAPMLPGAQSALPWFVHGNTDVLLGGKSVVKVDRDLERLRFDFTISSAIEYPLVAAELYFTDQLRKPVHTDLTRFSTIGFYVKCSPANTFNFSASTFDPTISKRGDFLSYRTPTAFFSCNEKRSYVEIDLTKLENPQWWFKMFKLDMSRQGYHLDQVARIAFANTFQSPADVASSVEISDLVLTGRDARYLVFLGALLLVGWTVYGVWFFRRHSLALTQEVRNKLQQDLPLVAYQQLSMEPHRDKEKAAVLRHIGTAYADPDFNLDKVVEHTGVNRNKINDMLKCELGFTFSGYLNKLRLTEAARLLADKSSATVAEIAYVVGYGNVSYFNKLFKEEYGCPPKAFRDACGEQAPTHVLRLHRREPEHPRLESA